MNSTLNYNSTTNNHSADTAFASAAPNEKSVQKRRFYSSERAASPMNSAQDFLQPVAIRGRQLLKISGVAVTSAFVGSASGIVVGGVSGVVIDAALGHVKSDDGLWVASMARGLGSVGTCGAAVAGGVLAANPQNRRPLATVLSVLGAGSAGAIFGNLAGSTVGGMTQGILYLLVGAETGPYTVITGCLLGVTLGAALGGRCGVVGPENVMTFLDV